MPCERCNYEIQIGDFPFCRGSANDHQNARFAVIGDDIPGGYLVRHGACWSDGTPRRFYSKSAIREAAAKVGLCISGETPKPSQQIVEQRQRDQERRR